MAMPIEEGWGFEEMMLDRPEPAQHDVLGGCGKGGRLAVGLLELRVGEAIGVR